MCYLLVNRHSIYLTLLPFLLSFFFIEKNLAGTRITSDTSILEKSLQRINSNSNEIHPFISPDGQHFYFVRQDHEYNIGESNHSDIWVADLQPDGLWGYPVNLGFPINSEELNLVVGISLDASVLYFTNGQKVFSSKRKGRIWSNPEIFFTSSADNSDLHFFVSTDEKYIIFSAKNVESIGGNDLFVCLKDKNGNWQKPIHLGDKINTAFDEKNSFLAADGHTFYFCSNKPNGLGGLDWYVSNRLDDSWQNWSAPENLGKIINTPDDDEFLSLSFDEKKGFTTVKERNQSDIRAFSLQQKSENEKIVMITGKLALPEGQKNFTTNIYWQAFHNKMLFNSVKINTADNFKLLLAENDAFAFYAQDKNYFSSLTYLNFNDIPLKMLDSEPEKAIKSYKDSLNQNEIEMLLIRVRGLNNEITAMQNQTISEENAIFQALQQEKTSFAADENLEKLKLKFEEKEKFATISPSTESVKTNLEEEITTSQSDAAERSLVRAVYKHYLEQQKEAENNSKNTVVAHRPSSIHEERSAIDDIASLEGATFEQNFSNFQELSTKVKNDIALDVMPEIKLELYKELIASWSNWSILKFKEEENKMLEHSLPDKKRTLLKQVEQQLNKITKEKSTAKKSDIEQNLYETLLPDVKNRLIIAQKPIILKNIDWQMTFLLKTSLRSILQGKLQEKLRKQMLLEEKSSTRNNYIAMKGIYSTLPFERHKNIMLDYYPIEVGEIIPLNGIFFLPNSNQLSPNSELEILRIKKLMDDNPNLVIEIRAHTSDVFSYQEAQILSTNRATALRDELIKKGAFPNKILFNGYGKLSPLSPNSNQEARWKNQRVEMKILVK